MLLYLTMYDKIYIINFICLKKGGMEKSMLTQSKKEFIEFMMSADVLRFGDFVTKSGRNTPYFVNTGNYKTGAQFARLSKFYADLIQSTLSDEFDALFGPAYKGIVLAAGASGALYTNHGIDKPYFYNRKEVKDHGEGGSLVGYKPQDNDRVIIVEDVITAGTALRETLPILNAAAKLSIKDMFISVNRCEYGQDASMAVTDEVKKEFDINVHSIIDVVDIYEYLKEKEEYKAVADAMQGYMQKYCVINK